MKYIKVNLNIIIIYINVFFLLIKCHKFTDMNNEPDINNNENNLFFLNEENRINNVILNNDDDMIEENIEIGKIYKNYLFYPFKYLYKFNTTEFNGEIVRIHFYTFDFKVQIFLYDESNYNKRINEISNYDNAYYIDIKKEKINNTYIIIEPLKNLLNDKFINRTCVVTINSIAINDKSTLETSYKRDSSIIYFDQNLDSATFLFDYKRSDFSLFSFLIKENAQFEITAYKNEKEFLLQKNISYNDQIIFSKKTYNMNTSCSLTINIRRIGSDKNVVMKFLVSSKNSFILLEKNELNIHFTTSDNREQFNYMEVFKGEEGEIILDTKRKGGLLYAKIINRTMEIKNFTRKLFPENELKREKEYIVNNKTIQKLSFTSNDTDFCIDGCYLLMTFCSKNAFQEYSMIYGGVHTLLPKIWDDTQVTSQLTQIYFNEHIKGTFSKYIKNHYYYLFIPEEIDYIIIEIKGNSVKTLIGEGKLLINRKNDKIYELISEDMEINENVIYLYSHDLKINAFKEKYISFSLSENKEFDNSDLSYYSFRILKGNSLNIMIYPLDTDYQSICKPYNLTTHFSCFFLLENNYNELSYNMTFYASGEDQNSLVTIKGRLINKKDLYKINNLTLNDLNDLEVNYIGNNSLTLFEEENISDKYSMLFEFSINENSNIKVLSTILNNFLNVTLYSSCLSYNSKTKFIEYDLPMEYFIRIKNIKGIDSIQYLLSTAKILFENQIVNFAISSEFKILRRKKNYTISYIQLNNQVQNKAASRIDFGYFTDFASLETQSSFYYYLKFKKIRNLEINFYFSDEMKKVPQFQFNIKGYITFNYDIIKLIKNNKVDLGNPIKGLYNNYTNTGFIKFNETYIDHYKNNISKDNEKSFIDKYFIIELDPSIYYLENFNIDLLVTENYVNCDKDEKSENKILINKYISGTLNPLSEESKLIERYKVSENELSDQPFIFEFSSNYKNIEINIFSNNSNQIINLDYEKRVQNGIQEYILKKNNINNFIFEISTDNIKNLTDNIKYINYMFKYYYYDEKNEIYDFIFNNSPNITKLNQYNNKVDLKIVFENIYLLQNNNTKYLKCQYHIRLYSSVMENELLNTTAYINSEVIDSTEIITVEGQKNFTIELYELSGDEEYKLSVLLKFSINGKSSTEEDKQDFFRVFEIEINPNEYIDDDSKISQILFIACSILFLIVIIAVIITIKLRRKNKDLQDRILTISFTEKVDDILDKEANATKSEEDYETTFI